MKKDEVLHVEWTGPYAWPGYETTSGLPAVPNGSGVYLFAAAYQAGYIIYAAGMTTRSFSTRLREHTRKYLSGDYTILDMAVMSRGHRKEIWHGWSWTPEKREEFERRRRSILDAAHRQLGAFRLFVAAMNSPARVLKRLEAAIMNAASRLSFRPQA